MVTKETLTADNCLLISLTSTGMVWYTKVYRPTRHSIGHFGDGGPEQ